MLSRQCSKLYSSRNSLSRFHFYLNDNNWRPLCFCRNIQIFRPFLKNSPRIDKNAVIPTISYYDIKVEKSKRTKNSSLEQPNFNKSSEQLLEKLIAGLSSNIHQKNRVYKNDFERVLNKVKELNFSTKKQSLLLLRCCSDLMPDEPPASRMTMVEEVWKTLKSHTQFDVDHYNELLHVYIANNRTATISLFLQQMEPVKPNATTYELFIRLLGEAGDINQATEVIANMKAKGLSACESIFNSLIVCQGKVGNLKQIEEILLMMTSLKIKPSAETYVAVIRSCAWNKKGGDIIKELDKAKANGIQFEEKHIMEIVKTMAIMNMDGIIPEILQYLPEETLKTPSISPYMQSVATGLVFQNYPVVALEIYKCLPLPSFGPKDDKGLHGRSLVRDCVKASTPSSTIGFITQQLMSSGRNPIAIQNACEAALQQSKVPLALDLFIRMKQLGLPIRPHYFWPIMIHSSKSYGEKGIMNTLTTMAKMDVKPDYETLMDYTMPYVSFTSPQNLMKKFQETGLSITTVLTPMMETLLNMGQVRAASEICEIFNGKVDVDKILKPLVCGYQISGDLTSAIHILEDAKTKAIDDTKDWLGRFLCVFFKEKKAQNNLTEMFSILKALQAKKMTISTSATDYMLSRIPDDHNQRIRDQFHQMVTDLTDEKMVDEGEMFTQQIPHPKNMTEEALRAHLVELEAKGMNTRGVLRKLLQMYCKNNNLKAARDILEKCTNEGIFLSAGMKASIFDLHVKLGEIESAEEALADLNKTSPNFTLDEHKIIDFATLMVLNHKFDKAFQMIEDQAKKRQMSGGRNVALNCWRLLNAMATNKPELVRDMFDKLCSLRYCSPGNALMGPLVKAYLLRNDLKGAVQEYNRLANKYNKTPLKHELLVAVLKNMGDGGNEENFLITERSDGPMAHLAKNILEVDRKVHGAGNVQLTLISALADVGYSKTLRKLFLDPTVKFHPDALMRRCERFADEGHVKALETIVECARDLRRIDIEDVCDLILDVHQRTNRTSEAIKLWEKMQESEITPSKKFIKNMCSFLESHKKPVPPELQALLGRQAQAV